MADLTSVSVSAIALGFTTFSFWWMNWRPGKLKVVTSQNFTAGRGRVGLADEQNAWFVGLPLIFLNIGARPLVVESLRLVSNANSGVGPLKFDSVETPLSTLDADTKREQNYLPRLIKPNEAISEKFVFLWSSTTVEYERRVYVFQLEAKLAGVRAWRKMKEHRLDFRNFDDQKLYELNAFYKAYQQISHVD